jgi:hypothetical protein
MAPEVEIPAHVLRFVLENINTVPELETLLMMNGAQDRRWVISDVASHNYITEQRAEETLGALRRRGLVSVDDSLARFRFSPATDEIRKVVADLALCYRANLSRIATLIHSKPSASVTEFARAFDLKKDR